MGAPRFFCDACGAEVARDTTACPQCGRSFSSIRCSKCGFSGEEALFQSGCPSCGQPLGGAEKKKPASARGGEGELARLPVWVYALTAAIFFAVLALLLFYLNR